tara:strand:+ start:807 stop:1394 length:588 start_codon:yes stop_codon:yes gene_type:complete
MKKIIFLIIVSLIFASCGPTDDEIQSQIDNAVNEALEDNASSNTTVAEVATTTTQRATTTTQRATTTTLNAQCTNWAAGTYENLSMYQTVTDYITSDLGDVVDGYMSYDTFLGNLYVYEEVLYEVEADQKRLRPNSGNQSSHNYLLDAINATIISVGFTILGVEEVDADYLEIAIMYTEDASRYIGLATNSLSDC